MDTPFQCEICKKVSSSAFCDDPFALPANECGHDSASSVEQSSKDMKKATSTSPFTCPHSECDKSYKRQDGMKRHAKTHDKNNPPGDRQIDCDSSQQSDFARRGLRINACPDNGSFETEMGEAPRTLPQTATSRPISATMSGPNHAAGRSYDAPPCYLPWLQRAASQIQHATRRRLF